MKDAVVAVDAEDRVIYLNAAAEAQYGQGSSEALGHPLAQLFAVRWYRDDDRAAAAATLARRRRLARRVRPRPTRRRRDPRRVDA